VLRLTALTPTSRLPTTSLMHSEIPRHLAPQSRRRHSEHMTQQLSQSILYPLNLQLSRRPPSATLPASPRTVSFSALLSPFASQAHLTLQPPTLCSTKRHVAGSTCYCNLSLAIHAAVDINRRQQAQRHKGGTMRDPYLSEETWTSHAAQSSSAFRRSVAVERLNSADADGAQSLGLERIKRSADITRVIRVVWPPHYHTRACSVHFAITAIPSPCLTQRQRPN